MTHEITFDEGGEGNMSWIRPVCSCGWEGSQQYAYNDDQYANASRDAERHKRAASTQEGEKNG